MLEIYGILSTVFLLFYILLFITGKAKNLFAEKEKHAIIEKEEITLSNMVASSNDHFVLSAFRDKDRILYGADVYNAFSKKTERIYACKKEDLEEEVEKAYKRYGRSRKG